MVVRDRASVRWHGADEYISCCLFVSARFVSCLQYTVISSFILVLINDCNILLVGAKPVPIPVNILGLWLFLVKVKLPRRAFACIMAFSCRPPSMVLEGGLASFGMGTGSKKWFLKSMWPWIGCCFCCL